MPIALGVIDLDELAQAASQLEPLPTSATRLAALVCAGAPELGQVVEIVQFDEALTASLLRSANSSWSASRSEITTVRDAVIRLGASPVLALTLGMNVRRHLGDPLPQYGLSEGELWRHSVAASLAAELLAPRAAHRPPPEAATAALLHDVGKLVMARFLDPHLLDELHELEEHGRRRRIDAEATVLGIDHAELGGLIARSWALPESLVRGIREHGRPRAGLRRARARRVPRRRARQAAAGAGRRRTTPISRRSPGSMGELGLTARRLRRAPRCSSAQRLDEVEQPLRVGGAPSRRARRRDAEGLLVTL